METLQLLRDYASTNENVWLTSKLDVLDQEIQIAILEAEIKQIKKLRDQANKAFSA